MCKTEKEHEPDKELNIDFEFVNDHYYILNGSEMSKNLKEDVKSFLMDNWIKQNQQPFSRAKEKLEEEWKNHIIKTKMEIIGYDKENIHFSGYAYVSDVEVLINNIPSKPAEGIASLSREITLSDYGNAGYELKEKLDNEIPANRI